MKLLRRDFLQLAAGAATLPAVSRIARAEAYPSRPVRLIVGFAAAGTTDIGARLMGQWLSDHLGQQFIVENRPGAGSSVAAEFVAHAPADGYTLLLSTVANAINTSFYHHLSFDFEHDIAPVANIMQVPLVMEVNPSVPAKTASEFIAYARANPGKITMASSGVGTSGHISAELFSMMAGVKMVHVPYRGAGPALVDVIAGQCQVIFDLLPSSIGYIRSGSLRALAMTTTTRSNALPDVPVLADSVPGYEFERLDRRRRAEEYARCHHRSAQQNDQRRSRRSRHKSALRRSWRRRGSRHAGRLRQVHRKRNREMGQGDQVRGYQSRLIAVQRQLWCRSGAAMISAQNTLYFDCGAYTAAMPIFVTLRLSMLARCGGESRQPEKASASV